MIFPLIILSAGSIFWGFLSKDLFIGLGSSSFSNSIYVSHYYFNFVDSEFLSSYLKNIPFLFTLLGFILSLLLINCFNIDTNVVLNWKLSKEYRTIYTFLSQKWNYDQLALNLIVSKTMQFGYVISFQLIDKGLIEYVGPRNIGLHLRKSSKFFSLGQSGYLYNYVFLIIVSLTVFLSYTIFFVYFNNINPSYIALIFTYIFYFSL
jgi:NADH-ubiquinone oxidoreductase chain 5